ncbi:MAG: GAF domain-containing sensor histidine kinase, partial [Gemmatimonadales bacterium]
MEPVLPVSEIQAALLQGTITAGMVVLCAFLYREYHKPYFLWWAVAWAIYFLRIAAIVSFVLSGERVWLFWHQVVTGWTALALLWAALAFSREMRWRPWFALVILFPPVWSFVAIYRLDNFLLAAGPAVLFLSLATFWTGMVFLRYWRRVRSPGAALLAGALLLWSLHHLDYPSLRARGAWSPWGYYLDILFILAIGAGTLLLVLEDVHRGVAALAALSGDLHRGGRDESDALDSLLARPLSLAGVRGSALFELDQDVGTIVRGAGICADWTSAGAIRVDTADLAAAVRLGRPALLRDWSPADPHAYAAVLPLSRHADSGGGALIIVGDSRDPFTALDEDFLVALGQQVGAALENADLDQRLRGRTRELERLGARMVEQHEEQRRRLSQELHDETAQVFSAVKMQLGVMRETLAPETAGRLTQVLELVDEGITSIRNVTNDLRPPLLDDLGLMPALRALATEFAERTGLDTSLEGPGVTPELLPEAELALFRALQEGLSNTARHARARSAMASITVGEQSVILT